ncbi:hypothetical protein N5C81_15140 [Rhizobium pusense]|uniref:hypothetical protein n=1 Tax=Agrobacterium pusense TaxID=648995 RepID=UPI002447BF45|nr:hypothetical protein [Agrobacterium pusense]MDH1268959.1 hypothetical protein [Agrobacterium pusense]
MVTDEMVEKAAVAMCLKGGFDPYEAMPNDGPRWKYYVDGARAALEAALSAAEPVGWFNLPNDVHGYQQVAKEYEGKLGTVPLYAAPTAPYVAVKQLQWDEDGDNLKARMGDREWMLNITSDGKTWAGSTRPFVFGRNLTWSSVPNCSMVSLEAAKAACQADCQSRYAALSAQVQDVAGEHVAWRLRHKNDGPHMWEYYQLPEAEASDNVVIQKLTIKQLIDILNDDKHAGAQERPPEPHSPNASVPIDLLQKIWAEMYYGVGGEGGIDDSIAQWNLNEVVDILAMAGALPDVDEPTVPAKQEG